MGALARPHKEEATKKEKAECNGKLTNTARSSSCVASTSAWAKAWIRSVRPRRRRVTAAIAASSWVRGPKKTSLGPARAGCDPAARRPLGLGTRVYSPLTASAAAGAFSGTIAGSTAGVACGATTSIAVLVDA